MLQGDEVGNCYLIYLESFIARHTFCLQLLKPQVCKSIIITLCPPSKFQFAEHNSRSFCCDYVMKCEMYVVI